MAKCGTREDYLQQRIIEPGQAREGSWNWGGGMMVVVVVVVVVGMSYLMLVWWSSCLGHWQAGCWGAESV
jgi:hypothetical protein